MSGQDNALSGQSSPDGADPVALRGSVVAYRVPTGTNSTEQSFVSELTSGPLRHVAREQVATASWSIEMLGDLAHLVVDSDGPEVGPPSKAWLLAHDEHHRTLVLVADGWANITSVADDIDQARATAHQVAQRIRAFNPDDPDLTPVTFWALNHYRWPDKMRRRVETPTWEQIRDSYSHDAQAGMHRLLGLDSCPKERMILWHGPPGTGKTYALRALARQWRDWCNIAYITDPENLLGDAVNPYMPVYLFQVVSFADGHTAAAAARRATLIVLEDAGELMMGEARRASAQGLSRLLNLTDGILGQSVDVMVLITTNEPLGNLHPAVTRPGRCLEEMEFGPLGVEQANQWLARNHSPERVDAPSTLAELYATAAGKLHQPAADGDRVSVLR